MMCLFVPVCEQPTDQLKALTGLGQTKERQSHKEGAFKKDVAQETV